MLYFRKLTALNFLSTIKWENYDSLRILHVLNINTMTSIHSCHFTNIYCIYLDSIPSCEAAIMITLAWWGKH